jgi:putative chitinase
MTVTGTIVRNNSNPVVSTFGLTKEKFLQIVPEAKKSKFNLDLLVEHLNEICGKLIDEVNFASINRQAGFIAQCAHESGYFCRVTENLNYSAEGLVKIFPKYFPTIESTKGYARMPEKIANKVYANRMGNGPETSGDGWKFRGRGFIQLTGRSNYLKCGPSLGVDLTSSPEYLETVAGAIKSAYWFWNTNALNAFADADDIKGMTKRINGGFIGLEERKHLYDTAKKVLITI